MRTIIIINTKTQSQHVIESSAKTLGELKQECIAKGIDVTGMAWHEGHLRAEFKDDASILPTNIEYKGKIVNDLVFSLTVPKKEINSGAYTRKELYDKIKELQLEDTVKNKFGKNFTQVASSDLEKSIDAIIKNGAKPEVKPEERKVIITDIQHLTDAFVKLLEILDIKGKAEILDALTIKEDKNKKAKLSQEEINEMFDFLK